MEGMKDTMTQGWDKEVDVLVVGSGAGGLMSALVADFPGSLSPRLLVSR